MHKLACSESCVFADSLFIDEHKVSFIHLQQQHDFVQRTAVLRFDVERPPLMDDAGCHALIWGPTSPVGLANPPFPAGIGPLEPIQVEGLVDMGHVLNDHLLVQPLQLENVLVVIITLPGKGVLKHSRRTHRQACKSVNVPTARLFSFPWSGLCWGGLPSSGLAGSGRAGGAQLLQAHKALPPQGVEREGDPFGTSDFLARGGMENAVALAIGGGEGGHIDGVAEGQVH